MQVTVEYAAQIKRVAGVAQDVIQLDAPCPVAEIGQHMGTAFNELFDFFARHGIQPQGGPMAVYPSMPSADTVRFRCGALVRAEDLGKGYSRKGEFIFFKGKQKREL